MERALTVEEKIRRDYHAIKIIININYFLIYIFTHLY